MNNLKRVLSLGLTGTMLTGMMVMGASAANVKDFTDSSEIKNQEAVTTMAALGVIKGKDTGAFDPNATVTRAEMAKMITIMLNGGKDPVLGVKTAPSYTDIKGHWAESYIEYCTSNGIIAGQGDGTFAPDATVTGSAAAKMTMVALGYDPSVYGFMGVDWEINTNRNANAPDADLYDGLSGINPSQGLSRDNAAQMLYNALDAKTKVMTPTSNTNGTVEYTYTNGDSMMEAKFNAVKVEGVVEANEVADLTSTSDKGSNLDTERTRLAITNYGTGKDEQDDFKNTLTIKAVTGLEELGRSVNVYVKKNSSSSKAEILGTVIVSSDNTVVTDYSSDSINTVADDNNLNVVDGTMTAANYQGRTALKSADAKADGIRGVEKVLIDNDDDGNLDYVLLNTYAFGKVTSYVTSGDGSMTVSADKAMTASDKDDVVGFENVAKNDYVLAAYIGGNLYVEKAKTVNGNLDSYKADSTTSKITKLEVSGTNYNVSWIAGYTAGTDDITAATAYGKNNLDTEATFYLGKGDYIAAVGAVVENAYNYALVLAVGNGIDDQVKVALSDGSVGTYTVNTNGDTYKSGAGAGYFDIGSVCSYSIGSNGKIKLTEATSTTLSAAKFTKGKTALSDGSSLKGYTNSNTAFFYVEGSISGTIASKNVDTYIGYASAPTLTSVGSVGGKYITNSAGRIVAVLFVGTSITTANVDDNLYIYSVGNTNNDYTTVKAFVAGSADPVTDLKVDSGSTAAKGIYTYTINSDKYYETETVPSGNKATNVTVTSANSKTFVFGSTELKIDANTLLVDDSDYLDDPTAELGAGPQEDDVLAYVLYDLDGSTPDTAKLVVVKNPENSTTPVASTDVKVIDSDKGTDYKTPTFYRESGDSISLSDMKIALTNVMTADGCTNIEFTSNTTVKFTKSGSSNTTTFANGGLTAANNQVFKYTVNGGTAKYALAATDIQADVANGKWYTDDAGKNYKATGATINISKDTTFADGYYKISKPSSVTNSATVALNGATITGTIDAVKDALYLKKGETLTLTLTSSAAPSGDVTVTVGGTGITAITTQDITFNANKVATVTVTVDNSIAADVALTVTVADKT